MATLPYKYRLVSNIEKELKMLNSMNVKEIYFSDQTFGALKNRAVDICDMMIRNKFNFGWVCFSRADITDYQMLQKMKRAGLHTMIFGVESGKESILKEYNKDISADKLLETFNNCRKLGIKTVGTFIIGLPEDDKDSILETISFAKKLDCDYASFNIYVPRMKTELRRKIIAEDSEHDSIKVMDQSGSYSVMGTKHLSVQDVIRLKNMAVRHFYFRPAYLLKRLRSLKNLDDFKREFRAGIEVLKDIFKNKISK